MLTALRYSGLTSAAGLQAPSQDSAEEDDDWEDKKIPTPRAVPDKKEVSDEKKRWAFQQIALSLQHDILPIPSSPFCTTNQHKECSFRLS